jgi:uncharacterized YccA/Bax inhibitor family protein
MQSPTDPPTPSEYGVIAVVFSVLLIAFGVVGLVVAFREPAEKHDVAVALEHYSAWSLGIGIGIAFVFWLIRNFSD